MFPLQVSFRSIKIGLERSGAFLGKHKHQDFKILCLIWVTFEIILWGNVCHLCPIFWKGRSKSGRRAIKLSKIKKKLSKIRLKILQHGFLKQYFEYNKAFMLCYLNWFLFYSTGFNVTLRKEKTMKLKFYHMAPSGNIRTMFSLISIVPGLLTWKQVEKFKICCLLRWLFIIFVSSFYSIISIWED